MILYIQCNTHLNIFVQINCSLFVSMSLEHKTYIICGNIICRTNDKQHKLFIETSRGEMMISYNETEKQPEDLFGENNQHEQVADTNNKKTTAEMGGLFRHNVV